MDRPAHLGKLTALEWQQLQALLDRFEHAWQSGSQQDLAGLLPPAGDRLRLVALLELIKSELEIRWRRGQRVLFEEYLKAFPELRQEPGLWPALLAEEFRVRRDHGDRPALTEYRERFPAQFAALARLCGEQPPPPAPAPRGPGPGPLGLPQRDGVLSVGGGYKLLERLGSGTFGEVWRALAPGGVPAAIKIIFRTLDDDEAQRELKALDLIRKLGHVFLLQLHWYDMIDNRLVIAMELADGSLRGRLKACTQSGQRGVPIPELLGYMREACEALDYAHAEGVLHRDIKPDNVLLLKGHVKVGDFGLACMLEDAASFTATTCGSAPYMAPEVWLRRASEQTDQYSLAASYVHLRLNRLPFNGSNMVEMALKHQQDPPDLDGLPEAEQHAIRRALAKEPAQRYPRCADFYLALEAAMAPVSEWATVHRPGPAAAAVPAPTSVPGTDPVPGAGTFSSVSLAPTVVGANQAPGSAPTGPPTAEGSAVPSTVVPAPRPAARRRRAWVWAPVALVACLAVAALAWSLVPPRVDFLPPGFEREARAGVVDVGGKRVFERIAYGLPDKGRMVFILIKPQPGDDLPPFYVMRNKVSNRVYQQLIAMYPERQWEPEWRKGGQLGGNDLGIEGKYLDCPVYRVSVDDAHHFARLLEKDLAELPTPREWDTAGGRFLKQEGPFLERARRLDENKPPFALKEQGPLPVGYAARDESCFGCQDMASNGREWTSCLADAPENPVPFDEPVPNAEVATRGVTYNASKALRFQELDDTFRHPRYPKADEFQPRDDISFRVVLHIPPGPGPAPAGPPRDAGTHR
jgi:formylglycine-generating enzyme required for sulfatase activity